MERGEVPARIVQVISDRRDAAGLRKAEELGIPAAFVPYRRATRERDETAMLELLRGPEVEWVCLAGFMRILSPRLLGAFRQRVLNIHPSLLPSFPGLDAQRQALEHGVKITGCTVHLVDEGLDSGPIVHQEAVHLEEGDTVDSLSARILRAEHRAYAAALRRLLTERWSLVGRRARFSS